MKAWREDPQNYTKWRARMRAGHLAREYGLTQDQYDAMLRDQGGVCAMCRELCSTGRLLAVDHDHLTGAIRGLLCLTCNRLLGAFERIRGDAETYLRRHGEGSPALPAGTVKTSIPLPRPPRIGTRRSKLTAGDIAEIRARYARGGVTQRALAAHYGISQNQVGRVIRREAWQEVA